MKARRIGFVIGNQLREIRLLSADKPGGGAMGEMRFQWIADWVNAQASFGLRYELHRPWRRYDALVFLKAMGGANQRLNERFRRSGRPTIFDANVNYYHPEGTFHYDGMRPTEQQTRDAIDMTQSVSAVIADSPYVAEQAKVYHPRVEWIPDNVNLSLVPPLHTRAIPRRPLPLWWSGQSVKLFELLSIEAPLRAVARHIELRLVTNELSALARWVPGHRERFERLLADVPHRIIPYQSIRHLLGLYAAGGVAISPRFLDNTYNLGHTEWKITLPMACGCPALAAPVPSYVALSRAAGGQGVTICATEAEWARAFDAWLAGRGNDDMERAAARTVVEQHYATPVIAQRHARFMNEILAASGGGA